MQIELTAGRGAAFLLRTPTRMSVVVHKYHDALGETGDGFSDLWPQLIVACNRPAQMSTVP